MYVNTVCVFVVGRLTKDTVKTVLDRWPSPGGRAAGNLYELVRRGYFGGWQLQLRAAAVGGDSPHKGVNNHQVPEGIIFISGGAKKDLIRKKNLEGFYYQD